MADSANDAPLEPEEKTKIASSDECNMAMLCHLGGIMGFVIPLIVWLVKKDQSKYVDQQGKDAIVAAHLPKAQHFLVDPLAVGCVRRADHD